MTIPLADQLASAKRELSLRQRVYPRLCQRGELSEHKAVHELACMEAIVATLARLVEETEQPGLFPERNTS